MEMLGEIAPSIEQTLVTKNTVIFEWTNFEGLEWKWVSLLTTNCPIIPFSPSAHALYSSFLFPLFPSFITFSLSYAQYQGVFAFRRLSPQGKCDFLRTKCQWATVALQLRMRQDAPSGGGGGLFSEGWARTQDFICQPASVTWSPSPSTVWDCQPTLFSIPCQGQGVDPNPHFRQE